MSDTKFTLKLAGLIVLFGATLSGGYLVSKIVLTPVHLVEKTFDANNVIYNYEYFKRQYNDINAFSSKIRDAESSYQLAVSTAEKFPGFETTQNVTRLQSVVLGLKNQRRDMIADYNAKSSMINRSIFRGTDVPEMVQE